MRNLAVYRKWLTTGVIMTLAMALAFAGIGLYSPPAIPAVQAQGGDQPADTVELFAPFWETWDLIHENYVDPLDDDALVKGAMAGMIEAVGDPASTLAAPELPENVDSDETRFAPFWDLWAQIHESYHNLDDNLLMEGALSSMMASIGDPHTDYMDPITWEMVNAGMSGEYEGIGATVRQDENTGGLELVSIMQGSPAEKAGLQPGDQIVMVEGKDITDLRQDQIISQVRGPAGTLVRLGIARPGIEDIMKFEVLREKITVPTVTAEMLDGQIGYIRLNQFDFSTSAEMRTALEAIDANNLNGLILDLRGNPGGYLSTSIEVTSAFVITGAVLIERRPGSEFTHQVAGNAIAPDVPMVVLVDQGSASASELVSGALQDHERATIVGMPTFGKGSVQTWHQLSNGGGIRITISRWYTPSGRSVSEVGIEPDVLVPYEPKEISGLDDNQLEAALQVLNGTYQPTAAE
ncbi:MAG: S41 family peptidase [Chloroflexi bacterium]|nr:S41 family peptidase [Chloroflexota bacterium]